MDLCGGYRSGPQGIALNKIGGVCMVLVCAVMRVPNGIMHRCVRSEYGSGHQGIALN